MGVTNAVRPVVASLALISIAVVLSGANAPPEIRIGLNQPVYQLESCCLYPGIFLRSYIGSEYALASYQDLTTRAALLNVGTAIIYWPQPDIFCTRVLRRPGELTRFARFCRQHKLTLILAHPPRPQ